MILYLCGPINGRSDADAKGWRESVKELWQGECLDPMRRDYRGRESEPGLDAQIVAGDIEDIHKCDVVLAFIDKPSFGTAMEIFFAKHTLQKPVVVIDATAHPLSPWVTYHADVVVRSVSDALTYIGGLA